MDGGIARCTAEKDHPVAQVGRAGNECIVEVDAVELRHEEIAHHGRDSGIVGHCLEGITSAGGLANRESTPLEDLAQGAAYGALVVHQEYGRHGVRDRILAEIGPGVKGRP
jgi:hypothetical protein